jgi:hypothetical protein
MEIAGTHFAITLGSWRLRLSIAVEDVDAPQSMKPKVPHRLRVVPDDEYSHRDA